MIKMKKISAISKTLLLGDVNAGVGVSEIGFDLYMTHDTLDDGTYYVDW